ncbi:Uncharacterised protein [uncultured archaeon]|nr:Uncharacterised protein [uncultured archaeon]
MAKYTSEDSFERFRQARTAAGASQLDADIRADALSRQQASAPKPDPVILEYVRSSSETSKGYRIVIYESGKVTRNNIDPNDSKSHVAVKQISDFKVRTLIEKITGYKFQKVGEKFKLNVPEKTEAIELKVNYGDNNQISYVTRDAAPHSPYVGLKELEALFLGN